MVKIRVTTAKRKMGARGIHLVDPTKTQIADAKERAVSQGFSTVWVHKTRKLKLTAVEKKVLLKIKKRQVKNVERPIRIGGQRAVDPRGKPLTATFLNIPNNEAAQFRKLERKGLISVPRGKIEYFTNFILTDKGKAQLKKPHPKKRKRKR